MTEKGLKTCILCEKQYKYCPNCPSKFDSTEVWRNIFCSANCRDVYHIYDYYNAGKLPEKDAVQQLKQLDISYLSSVREPIKSVLSFLSAVNTKPKKVESKEVVPKEEVKEKKDAAPKKRSYRKKNSEDSLKG